jgi:uncharacterized membrane protein YdbT with pleckstrin-like domain
MAEQTYMIFHPTRLAYIRWYIIAVFLITFGAALFIFSSSLPLVLSSSIPYFLIFFVISGIILIMIPELLRSKDKYAITNFRVIEKRGIISVKEDSIYWEKVANYELAQDLFDRIFKIGTIKLWSTGGDDDPEVVIKRAPHVNKIRFLLDKLIQKK